MLDQLTEREREIANWVSLGGTDRVIGRILGINGRTVQNHLHAVYHKLGINGRQAHINRVKLAVMVTKERKRRLDGIL